MGVWAGFELSPALTAVLGFLGVGAAIVVALAVYRFGVRAALAAEEGEWEDLFPEEAAEREKFFSALYANESRELPEGHFRWSSWD